MYRLALFDITTEQTPALVADRLFLLDFEGIGRDGTWGSHEEYAMALRARELYRDAAYAAGKWPTIKLPTQENS